MAMTRGMALALAAAALTGLSSCSSLAALGRMAWLELQPMRGFEVRPGQPNVHYQRGAEAAADAVAAALPTARARVESSHGASLIELPQVYLCADQACYERHAFAPAAAAESRPFGRTVVMNGPRLVAEGRLEPVLTHELSHAFWQQHGVRCVPRWWSEGLAVAASGGGGAEKASPREAWQAIRAGQVFSAVDESCWVRDSAPRAGISWPLFYRQSGLFVDWLREHDRAAFGATLAGLRSGRDLPEAIRKAYRRDLPALWRAWQDAGPPP